MGIPLPAFFRDRLRRITPRALRELHLRRYLPRHAPVFDLAPSEVTSGRRALFTYKTSSFRLPPGDPQRANFSHEGLGPAVVAALHNLGYVVDVIDYQHPDPRLERNYDLFIGHMNINFTRITRQLPAATPRLYFATTMPWRENNRAERERLQALERRRGVRLPEERMIAFNEDPAYRAATAIVCTGNDVSKAAYAPHPRVIPVRNAARHEPRDIPAAKNFEAARRHFLFFAGPGSVHKGLDLLLEVFPALADAGIHLHVCQHLDDRFARLYERELRSAANVHVHGNITPRSAEYYAVVDVCAFLISPSCAEGGQGAVVEALHQGLVPILSRECTVDVTNGGVLLPDCSLPAIEAAVREAGKISPDDLRARAHAAQHEARARYSDAAFVAAFTTAINSVVTTPPA